MVILWSLFYISCMPQNHTIKLPETFRWNVKLRLSEAYENWDKHLTKPTEHLYKIHNSFVIVIVWLMLSFKWVSSTECLNVTTLYSSVQWRHQLSLLHRRYAFTFKNSSLRLWQWFTLEMTTIHYKNNENYNTFNEMSPGVLMSLS